jgi:hypothetical protein
VEFCIGGHTLYCCQAVCNQALQWSTRLLAFLLGFSHCTWFGCRYLAEVAQTVEVVDESGAAAAGPTFKTKVGPARFFCMSVGLLPEANASAVEAVRHVLRLVGDQSIITVFFPHVCRCCMRSYHQWMWSCQCSLEDTLKQAQTCELGCQAQPGMV